MIDAPVIVAPSAAAIQPAESRSALPDGVRAMIEAAIAGGDAKAIDTVIALARQTHGFAGAEIDALAEQWRLRIAEADARKKREHQAALERAGFFDRWKGQVEFGASRSTGRTSYTGLFGSLGFEREGLDWRHKLQARLELQDGRNVADVERIVASWQPNYKFGDRLYSYGLAQFESDPIQGYDGRYTAGIGFGYALIQSDSAKLDVESGPAFRHVDEVDDPDQSSIAARASINLRWAMAPNLELKQTSALYFEEGNHNASALTTLDAQLIGPLKARFSYDVRYEDRLGGGEGTLDTLSRATLVYSF
jgi:putative salt-induced outer membrane protein